jgi:hypothetical protein
MILAGRCFELESVPYKALDAIIDERARRLDRIPASEAATLLPRHVGWWTSIWLLSGRHLAELDRRIAKLVVRGPPITTSEGSDASHGRAW